MHSTVKPHKQAFLIDFPISKQLREILHTNQKELSKLYDLTIGDKLYKGLYSIKMK